MRRLRTIIFFAFFFCGVAHADVKVSATVDPQSGTIQDTFDVSVRVFGDAVGQVAPPEFVQSDAFTYRPGGTTTQQTIINGVASNSTEFSFTFIPSPDLKPGKVKIPGGSVAIDGTEYYFRPMEVEIQTLAVAQKSSPQAQRYKDIDFTHIVDDTAPYIGEQVMYSVKVVANAPFEQPELGAIDLPGFAREDLGPQKETARAISGTRSTIHTVREALFPLSSGKLDIPRRTFSANVRVERQHNPMANRGGLFPGLFPDLFNSVWYDLEPRRLVAEPIELSVRPLPPRPANAPSIIPVGQFSLKSTLSSDRAKQGESITLTVTLIGDGNLRPIELQKPKDNANRFNFYFDTPMVETSLQNDRLQFAKTYKIALIPNVAGTVEVPAFSVTTFNPKTGLYGTLETERRTIEVAANDNFVAPPPSTTSAMNAADSTQAKTTPSLKQEVAVLKEDLLPQHVGTDTLAKPILVSQRTTGLISIAIMLSGMTLIVIGTLKRKSLGQLDEAGILKSALSEVEAVNGEEKVIADALADIIRTYIGKRLGRATESLTADEAAQILTAATTDKELISRVHEFLKRLETFRYSSSTESSVRDLRTHAQSILSAIDSSIAKKEPPARKFFALFIPLLLFAALLPRHAAAEDLEQAAQDAASQFNAGSYPEAANSYRQIMQRGVRNGHQFYNLGNTYYREGRIGDAIYNYRLARELLPRDSDIIENLALARKQTTDKIEDDTSIFSELNSGFVLNNVLSVFQLRVLFILVGALFWGLAVAYAFGTIKLKPLPYLLTGGAWLYFGVSAIFVVPDRVGNPVFALSEEARELTPGVIVSKEAKVFSGDSEKYQVIFLLHDGAEVLTRESRGDWVEVYLPKNRKGWVKTSDIKKVTF